MSRADAIIQDILVNHLPRVIEGLKKGYVDENQILVIYDHAVRARILKESAMGEWEARRNAFLQTLEGGCPNVESAIEFWISQNPMPV